MNHNSLHIGALVLQELKNQGKTVAWLADQLGLQRPNCYRIIRAQSLDTDRLFRISMILHHDFFADYSERLNTQTELNKFL